MKTNRVLLETIVITAITLTGMLILPCAKFLFALLPVAYLLIERHIRKRTWGDLGFNGRTFWADLRANWMLSPLDDNNIRTGLIRSDPAHLEPNSADFASS